MKKEQYYFTQAKKFFQEHRYEEAIPWLEKLLHSKETTALTYYMLACSLIKRHNEEDSIRAMELFRKFDEMNKITPCSPCQSLQYCRYILGRDAYYHLYDRKKAYDYFLAARMLEGSDSINAKIAYHLARIENFHGNYIEALCYATEARDYCLLSGEKEFSDFEMGFSLYQLEDYEQAKQIFLKMIANSPHLNAARYLAKIYEKEKNLPLAIQTLEEACSFPPPVLQKPSPFLKSPIIVSLYEDLGLLYQKNGQTELAKATYQKVKTLR